MFGIVGLGNPGKEYSETRHNVGFWVLDQLARSAKSGGNQPKWSSRHDCLCVKLELGGEPCFLLKPQLYMNRSGLVAGAALRYRKIPSDAVIVVHDDLDIAPGDLRLKRGGSAAGHRGVEDLKQHLNDDNFIRVRIGIGHPRKQIDPDLCRTFMEFDARMSGLGRGDDLVTSWVLGCPGPQEKELLDNAVAKGVDAIKLIVSDSLEAAQQGFNRRSRPRSQESEQKQEKGREK